MSTLIPIPADKLQDADPKHCNHDLRLAIGRHGAVRVCARCGCVVPLDDDE